MTWYHNNEGAAAGPHDEQAMRALIAKGVLNARSLVWQPGMDAWQEAGTLMPAWWQAPAAPEKSTKEGSETASISRRKPQPVAPSEKPAVEKKGLISRLFGRKK